MRTFLCKFSQSLTGPLSFSLFTCPSALGVFETHSNHFSPLYSTRNRRTYSATHIKQGECCKYTRFLGQLNSRGSFVSLTSNATGLPASLFNTCPWVHPRGWLWSSPSCVLCPSSLGYAAHFFFMVNLCIHHSFSHTDDTFIKHVLGASSMSGVGIAAYSPLWTRTQGSSPHEAWSLQRDVDK